MEDAKTNMRQIGSLLENLGLSKNEAKCYLASLRLGPEKISEIAKAAQVHRVNAYTAIKGLVDRGLVEQEVLSRGRRISPASLDHLQELSLEYQKSAIRCRWKVENIIPILASLSARSTHSPSVAMGDVLFFRGEDAFYQIADRTLAAPRGSTIYFLEIFDYFCEADRAGYDEEYYVPTRLERGLLARVIHPANKHAYRLREGDRHLNRQTRFIPSHLTLPCSIYIYGNEVAFVWTGDHIIGVIIKDSPIVEVMKILFEMVWQKAARDERKTTHRLAT